MEKVGKRYMYVITACSNWDGLDNNILFLTHNKKEAIARLKWLYDDAIYHDFVNDEGEEMFENRNYSIRDNFEDPNQISGYFYYTDDCGECDYYLASIKADCFSCYGECNKYLENRYRRNRHYPELPQ